MPAFCLCASNELPIWNWENEHEKFLAKYSALLITKLNQIWVGIPSLVLGSVSQVSDRQLKVSLYQQTLVAKSINFLTARWFTPTRNGVSAWSLFCFNAQYFFLQPFHRFSIWLLSIVVVHKTRAHHALTYGQTDRRTDRQNQFSHIIGIFPGKETV